MPNNVLYSASAQGRIEGRGHAGTRPAAGGSHASASSDDADSMHRDGRDDREAAVTDLTRTARMRQSAGLGPQPGGSGVVSRTSRRAFAPTADSWSFRSRSCLRRQLRQVGRDPDAALVELEQLDLLLAPCRRTGSARAAAPRRAPSRASPATGGRAPSAPCRRPGTCRASARRRPAGGACGGRTAGRGSSPRRRSTIRFCRATNVKPAPSSRMNRSISRRMAASRSFSL